MDLTEDIKGLCENIEEKVYEINNIIRDKGNNEEVVLELNAIVNIVKKIKNNTNDENAYNVRSELISIEKNVNSLFENISKKN